MKVMFIVYHDLITEARSQEILEVAKRIGNETVLVSYSKPFDYTEIKLITTGKGERRYFKFIQESIQAIKEEKPDIIILHDNYTAAILQWVYKNRKDIYIIYDSSELYIDGKPKTFKEFVARHMRYFEKKYLKYADVVIASNIERAKIMKKYFNLKERPIIFDNVHLIEDEFDIVECDKKYGHLFNKKDFYIVYAGGISKRRMTFELAEAVGSLGCKYSLIILGSTNPKDKLEFDLMIEKNSYNNVKVLGFIPRNEWRYILSKSHISVSVFSQDTVNNINCSSGKLYESLFEGKPVLTSTNPPLKRICNLYGVGISTDDFRSGILQLEANYDEYRNNVKLYIENLDYHGRIDRLVEQLKEKIRKDMSKELDV